jgi:hypothetical protein
MANRHICAYITLNPSGVQAPAAGGTLKVGGGMKDLSLRN